MFSRIQSHGAGILVVLLALALLTRVGAPVSAQESGPPAEPPAADPAPAGEPPPGSAPPGPAPAAAPPSQESPAGPATVRKWVRISRVRFSGNTLIPTEELERLLAPDLGHEFALTGLQALTERVLREYERRGFRSAQVILPPQDIREETLTLSILEGRVDRIVVEGNQHYPTSFLEARLRRALGGGVLNYPDLEKAVLLLNELPDLSVTTVLEPGLTPGTTTLRVPVEDHLPLHANITYDNYGSATVSEHEIGAGLELSNLPFPGGTVSASGVTGDDPSALRSGSFAYTVPLGPDGLRLALTYSVGTFAVGRELADLNITGTSQGGSASLAYPIVKDRTTTLSVGVGFDASNSSLLLLGQPASLDRLRIASGTIGFDHVDDSGRWNASLGVRQGLGHVLGAMPEDDPLASRFLADNSFTRFNLDLTRIQQFSDALFAILHAQGQVCTEELATGEQFRIGGADSVRGYPAGEFSGDEGYGLGLELRFSPLSNRELVQLVGFVDCGRVFRTTPGVGEMPQEDLLGAGVGLRFCPADAMAFRLDVGFPVGQTPSTGKDFTLYLQASLRF